MYQVSLLGASTVPVFFAKELVVFIKLRNILFS